MPYTFNRLIFRSALAAGTSLPVLLRVYSAMVCLELFLKEHLPTVGQATPKNHNIPEMLRLLAQTLPPHSAATLNSLSIQLSGKLASLWCVGKTGCPDKVRATTYPDVRYLRHSSDWPSPHSSDTEVADLFGVVSQILHEMSKAAHYP
jgi:hypothetical protein